MFAMKGFKQEIDLAARVSIDKGLVTNRTHVRGNLVDCHGDRRSMSLKHLAGRSRFRNARAFCATSFSHRFFLVFLRVFQSDSHSFRSGMYVVTSVALSSPSMNSNTT